MGVDGETTLGDHVADGEALSPLEAAVQGSVHEQIEAALEALLPRERQVVRLRFGFERGRQHTLNEVASASGVSRERIRQIEARALRKLRRSPVSRHMRHDLLV
jgi:RNA polymerase primary sigma factor